MVCVVGEFVLLRVLLLLSHERSRPLGAEEVPVARPGLEILEERGEEPPEKGAARPESLEASAAHQTFIPSADDSDRTAGGSQLRQLGDRLP